MSSSNLQVVVPFSSKMWPAWLEVSKKACGVWCHARKISHWQVKETLPRARTCRCRSRIRELCAWILANISRMRGLCSRTLATSHWMSKTPLLTMLKLSNNVSYLKTIKFNHFAPLQFKCLVQRHISQREKKTHLGKYFQHANVT